MKTLYTITLLDGRKYVGCTKQLLSSRISRHRSYCNTPGARNHNYNLYTEIRKLGIFDDCIITKIMEVEDEWASTVERNLIKYWNLTNPKFGLNEQSGGSTGYTYSCKTKKPVLAFRYTTGEFVGRYDSYTDAAIALKIDTGSIGYVIRGIYKQYRGYTFVSPNDTQAITLHKPAESNKHFCLFNTGV